MQSIFLIRSVLLMSWTKTMTEFCELMSNFVLENRIINYNIGFSDESTFSLTRVVNKNNSKYCSVENSHLHRERHTQRTQKLNVSDLVILWCFLIKCNKSYDFKESKWKLKIYRTGGCFSAIRNPSSLLCMSVRYLNQEFPG